MSDWGFKRLFGTEANKDLLKYLLNTIIDEKNITDIELLDTEHKYLDVEDGYSVFDIYCRCDDGSRIIVECQKSNGGNFLDRVFAYSAMAVLDQAQRSWGYELDKLYFIGFTTFNLFKDSDSYITRAKIMDVDRPGRVVYENYLQIYIETSKFVHDDSQLSSAIEELVYVLKNLENMDRIPEWIERKDNELTRICRTASYERLSSSEKEDYIMNKDKERIYQRSIEYAAKVNREEGRAEGREEGALAMAKAMKDEGLDVALIGRISGLTTEQIAAL